MLKKIFLENKKLFSGVYLGSSLISTYYLLKFINKNEVEKVSFYDLQKKNEEFNKATVLDDKRVFIERKEENKYYEIRVPNGEYFEKKI